MLIITVRFLSVCRVKCPAVDGNGKACTGGLKMKEKSLVGASSAINVNNLAYTRASKLGGIDTGSLVVGGANGSRMVIKHTLFPMISMRIFSQNF